MYNNNTRLEWADLCKGLGILLVVMGHTQLPIELRKYIYSFHMPMFFILSGYFFRSGKYDFYNFIKKKLKSLLLPYLFFLVITWIVFSLVDHPDFMPAFSLFEVLKSGPGNNPIWFLIILFFVEVLFFIVDKIILQKVQCRLLCLVLICFFCLFCAFMLKQIVHSSIPYNLLLIPFYLFFYALGNTNIIDGVLNISVCVFIPLLVLDLFLEHEMPYGIGLSNNWTIYFSGILIAILGSFLLYNLSYRLSVCNSPVLKKLNKLICFYGQYSIVVLGLHTVIVRGLRCAIDPLLLPNVMNLVLRQILLWIILAVVIIVLRRWAPILIGKEGFAREK